MIGRHLLGSLLLVACASDAYAQARPLALQPARDSLTHEFTRISSVRELPDGRALVIDSRERTLHLANFANGEVEQLGRAGRGPLEYERPTRLVAVGTDSTLLIDAGTRRWLSLAGPHLAITHPASDSVVERAGTTIVGADSRGHVLGVVLIDREVVEGDRQRERLAVLRVNRLTAQVETLTTIKGAESNVQSTRNGNVVTRAILELALTVPEQALLFPDGWVAIARQRPYRIDWIPPAGARISGAPLPWPDPPVNSAEIEIYRKSLEFDLGRPVPGPITGLPFVDVVSPFPRSALHPLPNGQLLVARSKWSGSRGTEYDVIDRRGQLTGQARLPANVRIVGVSAAHVFTVSIDEDGIETLRRHRWTW